jgi:predicted nucleic acid-binding protein
VEASRLVRDATDAPILASVIAALPDYFISGDEDLTNPETRRRSPVPILLASEFLEVYLRRAARRLQQQKPDLYLKILLYVTTPD